MIGVPPQPEETAWSHFWRLCLFNDVLREATAGKRGMWLNKAGLRLLCRAAGAQSESQYIQAHSMYSLVHPVAQHGSEHVPGLQHLLAQHGPCLSLNLAYSCPVCTEQDIETLGFCWFRRRHQLAGISVCHQHGVGLIPHRFQLLKKTSFLPEDDAFDASAKEEQAWTSHPHGVADRYSQIVAWVFKGEPFARAKCLCLLNQAYAMNNRNEEELVDRWAATHDSCGWIATSFPGLFTRRSARPSLYFAALAFAIRLQADGDLHMTLDTLALEQC